ncbi:MAG: NAD+ synthase, partial [Methanomicrobiales archaeon]|nr:NAD+ synthase [Methanomicrobiales archaeon]
MRIALLQVNTIVGDLAGNAGLIAAGAREAARFGPDLIVAPELSLTGCPPRDLLLEKGFVERSLEVLGDLAADLADAPPVLVGLAVPARPLINAAALLRDGAIREVFGKTRLSRGVLDECRYFEPAAGAPRVFYLGGRRVGVSIGEEIWRDGGSMVELVRAGADMIMNLSASPFAAGRQALREEALSRTARDHRTAIATANLVGGNDGLVFDGRSSVFGADGTLIARGAAFADEIVIADLDRPGPQVIAPDDPAPESEIWRALVLGTR